MFLESVNQGVNFITRGNFVESVTLNCRINGINFNSMVDSGAGCSLITKGMLRRLGAVKLKPPDRILRDASQNVIRLLGKITLNVEITGENRNLCQEVEFYVSDSDSTSCLLLGRNFMQSFGPTTFNFDTNKIKLGNTWCSGLQMSGGRVKLKDNVTIPAKSEKMVSVKWRRGNGLVYADFMPTNCAGVYAAKSRVLPDSDGIFNVSILNTSATDIKLKRQVKLGKLVS